MDLVAEIAVAVVTGVLAVAGAYAGNVAVSRKKSHDDALRDREQETRQEERMKNLEKKIDEHNNYGKKIGDIQVDIAKIRTDIEHIKKGINK